MAGSNPYLDMLNAGPAAVVGASATPPAQAQAATQTAAPNSVAAVDPNGVKDMETVQNAVAISKSNPYMAQWSAGDPTHVAATIPHYSWMDGISKAFHVINATMFPGPRARTDPIEEIKNEFTSAIKDISAIPSEKVDKSSYINSMLQAHDLQARAGSDIVGAAFSGISGFLTGGPGQGAEDLTGFNRNITGAILTMLFPLGMKAPKGIAGEVLPPINVSLGPRPLPRPEPIDTEAVHPALQIADQNAAVMDGVHSAVDSSPLKTDAPEVMQKFLEQQTEGTPTETVRINAATAIEAYKKNNVYGRPVFSPKDGILGWVPNIAQKLADAQQSGTDITVPTADYLTNVSEEGHAALRGGLSFGDGRSIEDAKNISETIKPPEAPPEGSNPAIEAAIAKVKQEQYLSPLFTDAKAAGMTEPQFALYSKQIEASDSALHERLIALETKQAELQQSSNWKAQAELEHIEARDAIASRPGIEARHFLATGEDLNGLGISPVKLDRPSVAKAFPDLVKDLPKEIFGPNGVGADDVAEVFGFRNGESMLRAIDDAERVRKTSEAVTGRSIPVKEHFNELVKNETDRRVAEKLGNFLSEESIEKAAREATSAPEVKRLLATELKALADQAGLPFDREKIEAHAEELFGRTRSADALNLKALERAVGRSGRAAEVALLKGKVPEAFMAKQQQLIANHMLAQAHDYIKEFTKATKVWSRWAKSETVGSIDQSYMNYIHATLDNMGFRINREPDELLEALGGKSLPDFILDNYASGLPIPFEGIAQKTPKDLTVNEFRANRDTLTGLATVGKFVNEIEVAGEKMATSFALARLAEQRERIGDRFTAEDLKDKSFKGRMASAWRSANSALKVMEFLFDKLDGGPKGIFNDVIVKPMQAAKHNFDDMAADLTTKFREFSATQPRDWDKSLEQKIDVPLDFIDADGQSVRIVKTKKDLIAAALHWGNSENRWKLTEGFGLKDIDFASAFASHMTKADWDFVQFYWNSAEDLWSKARAMHRDLNGVAPPSVKPEAFDTDFGTYKGGHAPIFYDANLAKNVKAHSPEDALFGNRFMRALPSKGYTIKRTGYTAPLELDLDMYKGRFGEMMHDVAYRPALLNADKFLRNQTVRNSMMKMVGKEYTDQTHSWLQNIAHAKDFDDKGTSWWNNFVKGARANMVSVNILYKVSTILKHGPTALAKSIDEVGAEPLMSAYKEMTRHPKGWFGALEDAGKESGEMRRRLINNDLAFREAFQNILKKQGWISKIQEYGAYGVSMSDQFSALPTYLAAKNMELEKGVELPEAIAAGEKAVRRAHGASGVEDVAPILASQNPLWKLVTPFMTFMNNGYNRILETGEEFGRGGKAFGSGEYKQATEHFSRATMKTFWNVVMPAIIEETVSGQGDTRKGFLHRFIDAGLQTLSSGIPIARDVVGAAIHTADYQLSPVESAMNTALQTVRETEKLMLTHRMSPKYIQHMFETTGYFTGLPTGQPGSTANFLYNWSTGKEHPHSIYQVLHGLVKGKSK